jgi:hypothetical protein
VLAKASITATGTAPAELLTWGTGATGWTLSMPACELSNPAGSSPQEKWALREVVYIMMPLTAAYPYDTDVHSVVLIFQKSVGALIPRVAVRVLKATFTAKFKAAIETIATGTAVLFRDDPG